MKSQIHYVGLCWCHFVIIIDENLTANKKHKKAATPSDADIRKKMGATTMVKGIYSEGSKPVPKPPVS